MNTKIIRKERQKIINIIKYVKISDFSDYISLIRMI